MRQDCDVWLLTEVHLEVAIPGMTGHRTNELMSPRKAWAAIFSKVTPQSTLTRTAPRPWHASTGSGS